MSRRGVLICGTGGHAQSVASSAYSEGTWVDGFYDDCPKSDHFLNVPVYGPESLGDLSDLFYGFHCAIGNNEARAEMFEKMQMYGLKPVTITDHSAIVDRWAKIGAGSYIGRMAVVGVDVEIGRNTIVNTKALVEHGSRIGDHCNISTSSVLNGDIMVGDGVFFGSCALSVGQKSIGEWSIVGAGAVVTKNVPERVVVSGVPAKLMRANDRR